MAIRSVDSWNHGANACLSRLGLLFDVEARSNPELATLAKPNGVAALQTTLDAVGDSWNELVALARSAHSEALAAKEMAREAMRRPFV